MFRACWEEGGRRAAVPIWLRALFLAAAGHSPYGMQLLRFPVAALSELEIPPPPCPTARSRHKQGQVRGGPQAVWFEPLGPRGTLFPLAAFGGAQNSSLPLPDERGLNPDRQIAWCQSIVWNASQRHGQGSKANRDPAAAWLRQPRGLRRLVRIGQFRSARSRVQPAPALFPDAELLRWHIPAKAARIQATDALRIRSGDNSSARFNGGIALPKSWFSMWTWPRLTNPAAAMVRVL